MIARQHRFHGHGSLNFVYRKGRSVRRGSLTLRYVQARQSDYRLAVVVSKKVSKSAVTRNRIRRRIYEAVRTQKQSTEKKWPYDMVITIFDESLADVSSEQLSYEVNELLVKAELLG